MKIRTESPADAEHISRIHYAAFKNHPQHAPGAEPTEHLIVERLRTSGALSLSLVGDIDGKPVGHIAFSPASVGETHAGVYLLGPVGVLPEHQGEGLGSALIREGLDRLKASGATAVVLVGEPGFYARFGFRSMENITYPGVPNEYVLTLSLPADPTPTSDTLKGDITAHQAFHAGQ